MLSMYDKKQEVKEAPKIYDGGRAIFRGPPFSDHAPGGWDFWAWGQARDQEICLQHRMGITRIFCIVYNKKIPQKEFTQMLRGWGHI